MQLTIKATGENAHVVSHLLAKNPNNLYERVEKGHLIRMFYSKFCNSEVEATIFVTPDSLNLVRNNNNTYDITSYINDREFAVSSIFCTLIRPALGTALNGQPHDEFIQWVDHKFRYDFSFGPVSSDLSDKSIVGLFQPLGLEVSIEKSDTVYNFNLKEKSTARYITLSGETTLKYSLRQIFLLIPVLDNYKHYYIDEKEIEKVERYGEGWLENHPQRDFILQRSLRFKEVYQKLETPSGTVSNQKDRVKLNDLRYEKIVNLLKRIDPKETVVDFGSGEGKLSIRLGFVSGIKEILAVEPSQSSNLKAIKRFEKLKEKNENFLKPIQMWGSLFYYDEKLKNKDVMILCEVIEHIDEYRLPKIFETILHEYRPKTLIVTTPNKEYNCNYENPEIMRHDDHRFEWTREEFRSWCTNLGNEYSYKIEFEGIGDSHDEYGCPTQVCIFTKKEVQ